MGRDRETAPVWKLVALAIVGLAFVSLGLVFIYEHDNPSVRDVDDIQVATGVLDTVERQGDTIMVRFQWGRTRMRIDSDDDRLLEMLRGARESAKPITLRAHLAGAHFDEDDGLPVFWLQSITYQEKYFGPWKARSPWSWRVLREEQVAMLHGVILHGAGNFNAALTKFNHSLDSQVLRGAQRGMALNLRADVYQSAAHAERSPLGRDHFLVRAADDYAQAARLVPDDSRVMSAWAEALTQLGAYDEAIRVLERAIEVAPQDSFGPGIQKSTLLWQQHRYEDSLRVLDTVAARGLGKGMMFNYHRGRIQLLLGRFEEASASFSKGLESQSDWPWAYVARACANVARGEVEQPLSDLRVAVEMMDRRPKENREDEAAWRAELLNNIGKLGRQEAGHVDVAVVTMCERFKPENEAPLRERSRQLPPSAAVERDGA
jgi:tetratricopeptide (TPR) repeat protein